MQQRVINDLKDSRIKRRGLSLSGGDPLYPENISEILALVQRVKNECPDKDIWLWTGYKLAELSAEQKRVLDYVDVLVDGKFEQENADVSLVFRGSSNQVIYNLAEKR